MKTAGLPENIRETIPIGIDPVAAGLQNVQDGATFFRTMDLDAVQYGLNIESTFEVIGPRNITITEIEFDTILMVERNVAHSLNWTFQNRYWIDPFDGFVWKSRQHIARSFPPIDIEILKPAA